MTWTGRDQESQPALPGCARSARSPGLSTARSTALAYGVRHLPVVVAGEVTGMVSARDLLELHSLTPP
jgi:CBS domain protein